MIKDLAVIIAAGGTSSRFGNENKLFVKLNGKPVFVHSIIEFLKIIPASNIVITALESEITQFDKIIKNNTNETSIKIVAGGNSRTQSVKNGLKALPSDIQYVGIHDAARPLIQNKVLEDCYDVARIHMCAIPGKPVTDTLKKVTNGGTIIETVNRENVYAVETPQVFNLNSLISAYDKAEKNNFEATDDAGIMEYAGHQPQIVLSAQLNMKITYAEDITLAQAYLQSQTK